MKLREVILTMHSAASRCGEPDTKKIIETCIEALLAVQSSSVQRTAKYVDGFFIEIVDDPVGDFASEKRPSRGTNTEIKRVWIMEDE